MGTIFWLIFFFFILPSILKWIQKGGSGNPNIINIKRSPLKDFVEKAFKGAVGASQSRATGTTGSSNSTQYFSGNMQTAGKNIIAIIILVVGAIILLNAIVIIPAGETGVRALFGKVKDSEISSGIHLINPLESIDRMSIRTEEYTMSVVQGEGQRKGADQITALTNEGLPVDLDITVFYHLDEERASDVYRELGLNFQEKIIRPEIRSAIREVVARYDTKAIYSEKRGEVANGIREHLINTVQPRGITVEQVLLRNVTLPSGLAESIQQKLQAEQDAQRLDFVLVKEEKEAERKRIEAQGQSDAQEILNKTLTPRYLEYLYVNGLKDRPGTIYVPTSSENGLPLFRNVQ